MRLFKYVLFLCAAAALLTAVGPAPVTGWALINSTSSNNSPATGITGDSLPGATATVNPDNITRESRISYSVHRLVITADNGTSFTGDKKLLWNSEAVTTLFVTGLGSRTAWALVSVNWRILPSGGDVQFSFGGCSGSIKLRDAMSRVNGSQWAFTSMVAFYEYQEEIGFHDGNMYWRPTTNFGSKSAYFDRVRGVTIYPPDSAGDQQYWGFLINPKNLMLPSFYFVWGTVNMNAQPSPAHQNASSYLTFQGVGISGIMPSFIRHPVYPDFRRVFENGWSPPVSCPVLKEFMLSTGLLSGAYDGQLLWTDYSDESTHQYYMAGFDPLDAVTSGKVSDLQNPVEKINISYTQAWVEGIAADNDSIWFYDRNNYRLVNIKKTGKPVVNVTIPVSPNDPPRAMSARNGTLWYVSGEGSFECTAAAGTCEPGGYVRDYIDSLVYDMYVWGLAYDGDYAWAVYSDASTGFMIYRFDIRQNKIVNLIYPPTSGDSWLDGPLWGISISGSNLWVFTGFGVYVLDVSGLQ